MSDGVRHSRTLANHEPPERYLTDLAATSSGIRTRSMFTAKISFSDVPSTR
jgi:hypothetical protein